MPDFRRSMFYFLTFCVMLAIGLSYKAFIVFIYDASIPGFFRNFVMKEHKIYQRLFLNVL